MSSLARSSSNSPELPESGRGVGAPRRSKTPQHSQLRDSNSPTPISRKGKNQVLVNLVPKTHIPDIKVSPPTGTATDPSTAHGRHVTPIERLRSNEIVRQNALLQPLPESATPSPAKSDPDAMELDRPLGIFGMETRIGGSHSPLTVRTDAATPSSLLFPYSDRSHGRPMEVDTVPSVSGSPGSPMDFDEN